MLPLVDAILEQLDNIHKNKLAMNCTSAASEEELPLKQVVDGTENCARYIISYNFIIWRLLGFLCRLLLGFRLVCGKENFARYNTSCTFGYEESYLMFEWK